MRVFQNCRYCLSLRPKYRKLAKGSSTFAGQIEAFLQFWQNAAHLLLPAEWAFFTNGDDLEVQRMWASEHGLPSDASLGEAQIEAHRADVFYNMDTAGWGSEFIEKLPGCVKYVIGWHVSSFAGVSFAGYDCVVCNFPTILERLRQRGCLTDYFFPACDRELALLAGRRDRPIDVLVVSGYTRHHRHRAAILEAVAKLAGQFNIVYHLDRSRLCRLGI